MTKCKNPMQSQFTSFASGGGGGGGGNLLRRAANFTDLGKTPVASYTFEDFVLASTTVANKNTVSGYGDLTETTAITGAFQVAVSGEELNAGGTGYTKAATLGQLQLVSGDHAISTGPFTASLAVCFPFGLGSGAGSLIYLGTGSGTRIFTNIISSTTLRFNNQAVTNDYNGLRTGQAINIIDIVREVDGVVKFYVNGLLAWTGAVNAGNLSAYSIFVVSQSAVSTVVGFDLFDEALDAAKIDQKWNSGAGTFWDAVGG